MLIITIIISDWISNRLDIHIKQTRKLIYTNRTTWLETKHACNNHKVRYSWSDN